MGHAEDGGAHGPRRDGSREADEEQGEEDLNDVSPSPPGQKVRDEGEDDSHQPEGTEDQEEPLPVGRVEPELEGLWTVPDDGQGGRPLRYLRTRAPHTEEGIPHVEALREEHRDMVGAVKGPLQVVLHDLPAVEDGVIPLGEVHGVGIDPVEGAVPAGSLEAHVRDGARDPSPSGPDPRRRTRSRSPPRQPRSRTRLRERPDSSR